MNRYNDDLLSSAEGVELLVTSAYAGLKGPNRDMHWVPMTNWTYGEVRSDNAYKGGGGVNDGDFCTLLETFKIDATWANADEKWFQLYCCLQRCNSALRVMNTLDENTLPVLKSRKAEMKVIRAHFFFELVRLFKQVPPRPGPRPGSASAPCPRFPGHRAAGRAHGGSR